jgi:hypothetical protein
MPLLNTSYIALSVHFVASGFFEVASASPTATQMWPSSTGAYANAIQFITDIHIGCSTASIEPVSFGTLYVFDRVYHSVQCNLSMWWSNSADTRVWEKGLWL